MRMSGKGASWGQGTACSGDCRASCRNDRVAEDECPGLALRQNCRRRGGSAVCPPVELSERCGGEETESCGSQGLGEVLGETFQDEPLATSPDPPASSVSSQAPILGCSPQSRVLTLHPPSQFSLCLLCSGTSRACAKQKGASLGRAKAVPARQGGGRRSCLQCF